MKLFELRKENKVLKEKIKFLLIKESMSFLKYMLTANALKNRFIKKKLTDEERNKFTVECKTYKEIKQMWKEYMGFKWNGELKQEEK